MEFCRIKLDQVDSTNNYAAKWLKMTKSVQPAVITARIQYQGRGQHQHHWQSPPDLNLTCSFIIFPNNVQFDQLAFFNKSIANATHATIHQLSAGNSSIKWPNDVWVNGKKIAGILIENAWKQQSVNSSIIGIGINVNQSFNEDDPWCSLFSLSNKVLPIPQVQAILEYNLSLQLELLNQQQYEKIDLYYHQFLLGKNHLVDFYYNQALQTGVIEKVDNWGRLILKTKEGLVAFQHGEVAIDYNQK